MQRDSNIGYVYIVGAGPGEPSLITLKGKNAIENADVILYDRLVNPLLLNYARRDSQKIYVGKEPTKHRFPQDEINKLLLEYALMGKTVVRLKGGDPYIFGRGSEEALYLQEHNIPFEVIPGITAALGASSYAGIPLTHRSIVTQVLFVTAHEDPNKSESQIDFESIPKLKNTTIVVYMGANQLENFVNQLIENGYSPETPAAIVENATTANQRTIVGTLQNIVEIAKREQFSAPMLTIISQCAEFSHLLNWFQQKPLFGKRIVTTRPIEQSHKLFELLTIEGASVIPFPVFQIKHTQVNPEVLRETLSKHFDWIVFTSRNGVAAFAEALKEANLQHLIRNSYFAALGDKTADELRKNFFYVDFVPSKYNSQAFLEEFTSKFNLKGKKILRIKGNFEHDLITNELSKHCQHIDTLNVYEIIKLRPKQDEIARLLNSRIDGIIFTASSNVKYFIDILGRKEARAFLRKAKVFSIGPMTEQTLRSNGIEDVYTAEVHTIDGIVALMKKVFSNDRREK
jgi:uroporphyrinogen III methyltransferase/synthase